MSHDAVQLRIVRKAPMATDLKTKRTRNQYHKRRTGSKHKFQTVKVIMG